MGNQVGVKYNPKEGKFYLEVSIGEIGENEIEGTLAAIKGWMKYLVKVGSKETPDVPGIELRTKSVLGSNGKVVRVEEKGDFDGSLSDEEMELMSRDVSKSMELMLLEMGDELLDDEDGKLDSVDHSDSMSLMLLEMGY